MAIGDAHRVCLVGAGKVAEVHAEVLACVDCASATAVCDPAVDKARSLAEAHGIPHVFASLDDAIASRSFDLAHVLVPPDLHTAVALRCIEADIGVLIEKPMTLCREDCHALVTAASDHGVGISVNHNAVFFPAYLELRRKVMTGALGPLQHLNLTVNFPAQALAPRDQWMLRDPRNLAYESATHPLSQIYDLAGPAIEVTTTVSGRRELSAGRHYYDTWQVSLVCERATAQLFVSYAGAYRSWQLTAICQDGVLDAEVEQNRISVRDRSRWGRYAEPVQVAAKLARAEVEKGVENVVREAGSLLRPTPRRDVYFTSMRESITAFHDGANGRTPRVDGEFGLQVVAACDAATATITPDRVSPAQRDRSRSEGRCDVAVLGGTGFIGTSLLEELLSSGMTVRVMARNTGALPAAFQRPEVQILRGDIADADAVARAVAGAGKVVHLAHGGRFLAEAIESSMVEPARRVAEECLRSGAERLVYAGTIASLYLGDPGTIVTGATPTDPQVNERGPYEVGKAESEAVLREYVHQESLPLCIMRPGIVIGAGGTAFHGGFGIWRADIHCFGWNAGLNPLPLVLADDVATAIRLALEREDAVGRSFNLVGDARLSARECVSELRQVLGRPLDFHPRRPAQHQALSLSKWLAKRTLGFPATLPSYRGVKSMGCVSTFDCSDVKAALGWKPVTDREELIERGLRVHRPGLAR
ncbi:MAG: NAD-dependent epimerase/dehydratase family protein [Solirubrobacterales bacterium]|nr:NAD-dependent epimerase/dehydratase family protein [Solirubrobacterales bacterium]